MGDRDVALNNATLDKATFDDGRCADSEVDAGEDKSKDFEQHSELIRMGMELALSEKA